MTILTLNVDFFFFLGAPNNCLRSVAMPQATAYHFLIAFESVGNHKPAVFSAFTRARGRNASGESRGDALELGGGVSQTTVRLPPRLPPSDLEASLPLSIAPAAPRAGAPSRSLRCEVLLRLLNNAFRKADAATNGGSSRKPHVPEES